MREIRERIIEVRNELEQTQSDFAKIHGLTRSQLSQVEIGHNKPSLDLIYSIVSKNNISLKWLIEGIGEKHISDSKFTNQTKTGSGGTLVITVDESGNDNISMVDIKASAGYPQHFTEAYFFNDLPAFKLPGNEFKNGIFRAFQVDGDSMYDTLDHGDWVICRYCDNHFKDIRDGYIHVIVTRTEVNVKRLMNRVDARSKIVLISDNDEYPTRELDAVDVSEIWIVKGRLGFNLRSKRKDILRSLNELNADIIELKNRVKHLEKALNN